MKTMIAKSCLLPFVVAAAIVVAAVMPLVARAGQMNIKVTTPDIKVKVPPASSTHVVTPPALQSQIGFPALDGSSKDAAKMGFKITPEKVEAKPQNINRTKIYTRCPACVSSPH